MAELLDAYFEHVYFDIREDVEDEGYLKATGKGGDFYQVQEGSKNYDHKFNEWEKLCSEGKFEEVYKDLNKGFEDLSWIDDFQEIVARAERANYEKMREKPEEKKTSFLTQIGIKEID